MRVIEKRIQILAFSDDTYKYVYTLSKVICIVFQYFLRYARMVAHSIRLLLNSDIKVSFSIL
jgi:hypothetical protein